jgi:hypothetical protein
MAFEINWWLRAIKKASIAARLFFITLVADVAPSRFRGRRFRRRHQKLSSEHL